MVNTNVGPSVNLHTDDGRFLAAIISASNVFTLFPETPATLLVRGGTIFYPFMAVRAFHYSFARAKIITEAASQMLMLLPNSENR